VGPNRGSVFSIMNMKIPYPTKLENDITSTHTYEGWKCDAVSNNVNLLVEDQGLSEATEIRPPSEKVILSQAYRLEHHTPLAAGPLNLYSHF
jgi:hypothetical protein